MNNKDLSDLLDKNEWDILYKNINHIYEVSIATSGMATSVHRDFYLRFVTPNGGCKHLQINVSNREKAEELKLFISELINTK